MPTKRKNKNYNSVIVTPGLRKRQSKVTRRLPSVVGGIWGFSLGGFKGAAAGSAVGYGLGRGADAYLGHNARRTQDKTLSKQTAHKRNQKAMIGTIYGSALGGGLAGYHSYRMPGLGDLTYKGRKAVDRSIHGDKFKFNSTDTDRLRTDSLLDNSLFGGIFNSASYEVENKPKDSRVWGGQGVYRKFTKTKSLFHAPHFDAERNIETGNPWLETRKHTITFMPTKRGKLLQKTEFEPSLKSGFVNYRRKESPMEALSGEKTTRLWGSAVHTIDKYHTNYAINTKKARNIGIGAGVAAAAAGGGYYYYRRRRNKLERVRNSQRRQHQLTKTSSHSVARRRGRK